ncbi:hypothetical protein SDRG_06164 [Saprolegnia diclina VS20]|uniref:Uncharacterized protein n=1 Tax=Saprolegnia diclina (strain VS20) TaxID=1156394 RepID=T0QFK0_SAPDV|nr:hypothetical protein SDRG_06164 [Saprolegnia diclina VS20]EQC36729.1 hypothetical protein SDRG_06164 [Saprolegnia diclina VS20]|eukprot:XP_008610150.1 hypothetical protein SDRG_06164 [Saprolegnia diclina VS20]
MTDVWRRRCLAACDDLEEEYQQALHEIQYRAAKTKAETPLPPSKPLQKLLLKEADFIARSKYPLYCRECVQQVSESDTFDHDARHRSAQAQETMRQLQTLWSTFQCKQIQVADDLYVEYRRLCQRQPPDRGVQTMALYTRDQSASEHNCASIETRPAMDAEECRVAVKDQAWSDHERFHINHALESAKKRIRAEHTAYEERLQAQVDDEMHKPLDEPPLWETRRDMLVSRQRIALEAAHRQQKVTLRHLSRQHLRHLVEIDCHNMVCTYTALVTDQQKAGMRAMRQWVAALLYVQRSSILTADLAATA